MIDVQTIYLREAVAVRSIRAVAALLYPLPPEGVPTAVQVEGTYTNFIPDGSGGLLVTLPPDNTKPTGWTVAVETALPGGVTKRYGYPEGTVPVIEGLLLVTVAKAATAVEVRLNNEVTPFTAVSPTSVLCLVPSSLTVLENVDVLASVPSIEATSSFEYKVVPNLQTATGIQKLVYQFVKLLQTTQGSDVLHPAEGGNLQSIVGTVSTAANASSIGARAMLAIDNTAAQIILSQTGRSVPAGERLARAAVIGVSVDPEDSTTVTISLRIETFSKDAAIFNFLLGKKG
jgi:hypothetical protein